MKFWGLGHVAEIERLVVGALQGHILEEMDLLLLPEPVIGLGGAERKDEKRREERGEDERAWHGLEVRGGVRDLLMDEEPILNCHRAACPGAAFNDEEQQAARTLADSAQPPLALELAEPQDELDMLVRQRLSLVRGERRPQARADVAPHIVEIDRRWARRLSVHLVHRVPPDAYVNLRERRPAWLTTG
jgi:hypothetical protein